MATLSPLAKSLGYKSEKQFKQEFDALPAESQGELLDLVAQSYNEPQPARRRAPRKQVPVFPVTVTKVPTA